MPDVPADVRLGAPAARLRQPVRLYAMIQRAKHELGLPNSRSCRLGIGPRFVRPIASAA